MKFHERLEYDYLSTKELVTGLILSVPLILGVFYFYYSHLHSMDDNEIVRLLFILSGLFGAVFTVICSVQLSIYLFTALETFIVHRKERFSLCSSISFSDIFNHTFTNSVFYICILVFSYFVSVGMRIHLTYQHAHHLGIDYIKNYFLTYPKAFICTFFIYFLLYVLVNGLLIMLAPIVEKFENKESTKLVYSSMIHVKKVYAKKLTAASFLATSILFVFLMVSSSIFTAFLLSMGWFLCCYVILFSFFFLSTWKEKRKSLKVTQ